jgi:DNA-binding Lrp family transcriptional regulator
MEISQALNIPKESARRKIIELEKIGVIKKSGKKIIIDKKAFPFIRPEKSIVRVSRFFATLSTVMLDEKIIQSEFTSDVITTFIAKNFSYIWKLYYELQIPLILKWKKIFQTFKNKMSYYQISNLEGCLNFIEKNRSIDKILIGIDNVIQLQEILDVKYNKKIKFPNIYVKNEKLIDPSRW